MPTHFQLSSGGPTKLMNINDDSFFILSLSAADWKSSLFLYSVHMLRLSTCSIKDKMLSYRRETALQGAL